MPCILTKGALGELTFPHFRHRNQLDLVTRIPPGRGMNNPFGRVLIANFVTGTIALVLPDKDPYGHHRKLVHFYQTDTGYVFRKERDHDVMMPLTAQAKLLVIPHLITLLACTAVKRLHISDSL